MKIFISHSYRDSEFAETIKQQLHKQNIETIQIEQIPQIGDNIAIHIEDAIQESDAYLILLSKHYSESKWSDLELMLIYDQLFIRKKGKKIFPILLDKSANIPSLLKDFVYVDFTDKSKRNIDEFVFKLKDQLSFEETIDYKKIKHFLKEQEDILKLQELDYKLQKNKQQRIRRVFLSSFLLSLFISLITIMIIFTKEYDIKDSINFTISIQNMIFYLFGFLTAIIPALYISLKIKNNRHDK